MNKNRDKLGRVETRLENYNEHKEEPDPNINERELEHGPLIQYEGWNVWDPNNQYLKSIKLDVLTFDDLNSQAFLEWFRHMNKYFTWYSLSEVRKLKFVAVKLTSQVS